MQTRYRRFFSAKNVLVLQVKNTDFSLPQKPVTAKSMSNDRGPKEKLWHSESIAQRTKFGSWNISSKTSFALVQTVHQTDTSHRGEVTGLLLPSTLADKVYSTQRDTMHKHFAKQRIILLYVYSYVLWRNF